MPGEGREVRCFVAVELSAGVRAEAARIVEKLRSAGRGVKWVEAKNLHHTLKFLGNVAEADLPEVSAALAGATRGQGAFDLSVSGVGCFPPRGRARVIWLGLAGALDRLAGLAAGIEGALEALGFAREDRPFSAHLTLGRVRQDRRGGRGGGGGRRGRAGSQFDEPEIDWREVLFRFGPAEAGTIVVGEVVLFKSELSPAGPTYTPLDRFPLTP